MANSAKPKREEDRRNASINLRISARMRELIDTAAAVSGSTRTDFVLESARRRAIDVVLDQRLFLLDADAWDAFNRALEDPAPPPKALRDLMARKAPWEP